MWFFRLVSAKHFPTALEISSFEPSAKILLSTFPWKITSGAHAVQLFESFADVISLELYEKYVQPAHEKIFSSLNPNSPSILFTKESPNLELMLQSGAKVLSVGNCLNLEAAKKLAPDEI
jgi:uroporphyrinogen decarboxylase